MKGQASLQFVFAVSMAFVFFIIFYVGFATQDVFELTNQKQENLHDLAQKLKKEISLAHEMQDGYERTIILPHKINSEEYSITQYQGYTIISTATRDFSIITTPYSGNFENGTNTIRKDGGVTVK